MAEGWISLYRKITEGWLWEDKPFSRGQAWIDMLLNANHKTNKIPFDGSLYEVERGSYITSIRKLSNRWGWSNTKVVKFLDVCVNEKMLNYKSDKKKTVVSIENYDSYQIPNATETSLKHHRNATETPLKHTNNNDNNNISYSIYEEPRPDDPLLLNREMKDMTPEEKLSHLSKRILGGG